VALSQLDYPPGRYPSIESLAGKAFQLVVVWVKKAAFPLRLILNAAKLAFQGFNSQNSQLTLLAKTAKHVSIDIIKLIYNTFAELNASSLALNTCQIF
jgi:hypothetical protein